MTREDFQAVPEELRAAAMLRCLVIPEEYEKEAARVLERYDPALDGALSAEQEELDALTAERERNGIKTLDKDPGGFTATLAADRGGYAFFSVPYDRGFHAQVNGKAAQILKTNGMMAVLVEPGENRIRFSYRNDDLTAGAVCTIAGFLLWGLSLSAEVRKKRSR